MPILTGDVDLNNPGAEYGGCTRAPCHGFNRGPGTLFLDESDTAMNNLGRFACFVDVTDPPMSQVLLCPLGDVGCVRHPHPGADLSSGVDDLNYVMGGATGATRTGTAR